MKISNGVKPLIVANWKMNPQSLAEAKKLFDSVKRGIKNIKKAEVVICPPYVQFSIFNFQFSKNLKLGAQDVFWEKSGAYTGEVSPAMLKDLGCQYVIVGHSERRRYFSEKDEIVNKKLRAVLEVNLNPILCIGESKEEREQGKTETILKREIILGFKKIPISKFTKVIVAYEPIWAIGTGKPCDPEEAQKMGLLIRKIISKIYNRTLAQKTPILYGGSVNSKNGASYIKEAGFQGLLVGGASLEAKEFIDLVRKTC